MTSVLEEDLNHVLAHTTGLWEELRGRRIFITGGTGFFGSWLLETFAWANDKLALKAEALVLSRDPLAFARKSPHLAARKAIQFQAGDVRSFAFPPGDFSHVIHAATDASVALNDQQPKLMLDTIVEGTRRVLDFARERNVPQLLLTSSGAVYGRQPPELTHIPEEYNGAPDPLDARSAYGEGKRMAEHLCALNAKECGLKAKIARCFAFVGPFLPLDKAFAVGNFIRDAMRGGPIEIRGDGTVMRSYLYGADLAIWLWTILFRGASCRAYNVGSSQDLSIAQLASLVVEALGKPLDIQIHGKPVPGQLPARYVPDVERAHKELGLTTWISLKEATLKTIKHHRQTSP